MKKLLIYSSFLVLFFMYHDASGIESTNKICRKALTQISQSIFHAPMVEVFKLSPEINSLTSCQYPLYFSEMNTGLIYFTELKKGNNHIADREYFFSIYDSTTSSWVKPINIGKEYSTFREVNKIMNFDEIFITINNDIYRVDFKEKTFSPQALNINTKYIETSPMLSTDGTTLYFISDRPGGFGGKDVWASERLANNKWGEPYNLGKEINTSEDEESPFLMSDGTTLYFSSKGHYSYGGYDVFVSTKNDDGIWSAPENLGAPVNSTSDDYYYISDSYGKMAYYSSDKLNKCKQDVFTVKYNSLNKADYKIL
jgi:hypothetical protein